MRRIMACAAIAGTAPHNSRVRARTRRNHEAHAERELCVAEGRLTRQWGGMTCINCSLVQQWVAQLSSSPVVQNECLQKAYPNCLQESLHLLFLNQHNYCKRQPKQRQLALPDAALTRKHPVAEFEMGGKVDSDLIIDEVAHYSVQHNNICGLQKAHFSKARFG